MANCHLRLNFPDGSMLARGFVGDSNVARASTTLTVRPAWAQTMTRTTEPDGEVWTLAVRSNSVATARSWFEQLPVRDL